MSEKFADYSRIEKLVKAELPPIFRVRQHFLADHIEDVARETQIRLKQAHVEDLIRPGMTVAITAGSRGIDNISVILREIVTFLKDAGAHPFLFPAMGSHGGAVAEAQTAILTSYGITEEFCGCPIKSSMETVHLGDVYENGRALPVYIDKMAYEADGIVVVNRVKPHTAFRGPVESGLSKMMCIGMGKQRGAASMHAEGTPTFTTRIPLFSQFIRTHTNILFGVATVENAYDQTNRIAVLHSEEIPEKEPALLEYARELMPRILIPETDVLVVKEMGKNISGSGMDPNITGRFPQPNIFGGIRSQELCVLDLTEESHGNGVGIGNADVTTVRCFDKMDFLVSYTNNITTTNFRPCKLPMVMRDDKMAIELAAMGCHGVERGKLRMVLIRNTLSIGELYLSAPLLEQAREIPGLEIVGECEPIPFNDRGELLLWNDVK